MKWKKYSIETTQIAEDILIEELYEAGLEGAQIIDNKPLSDSEKEQMFVDIPPDMPEDDGSAVLYFFKDEDDDEKETIDFINKTIENISQYIDTGTGKVSVSYTEDIDWINNWKKYFKQFSVGGFRIIPSWEECSETSGKVLRIDPGTAFGTGMHETTRLCILQLEKYVKKGCSVLDIGTGSGILSIVALKLGARCAYATDLDPCAKSAVQENIRANDIPPDALKFRLGNIITDEDVQSEADIHSKDIITANIITEVLVRLLPVTAPRMKPGAIIILSGILDIKKELVESCIARCGLKIVEITDKGEWISITATKQEAL